MCPASGHLKVGLNPCWYAIYKTLANMYERIIMPHLLVSLRMNILKEQQRPKLFVNCHTVSVSRLEGKFLDKFQLQEVN